MKVAILGFDVEGRSSYEYYRGLGYDVTICDQNESISTPTGAKTKLGKNYLDGLEDFDLLVRTPGLHPQKIIEQNPKLADKIWSNINEFLRVCPTTNIIGVTGTKGKGTASSLLAAMLEAAGKKVHLGGNIGKAALSMLPDIKKVDWVVLELSSFQLQDLKASPHIAVCLMVVPEHLNIHRTLQDYYHAKSQIFAHQTAEDIAIYYAQNDASADIANASPGRKVPYFEAPGAYIKNNAVWIGGRKICTAKDIKLPGKHNWQNVCAALTAAWQVTQDEAALHRAITEFKGLSYRLEFVREIDKVKYYNDSFGTTPETTLVALEAFSQPKVLIVGGSRKGSDYSSLAKAIAANNVREVLLMGDTANTDNPTAAQDILTALEMHPEVHITSLAKPGGCAMAEIVQAARNAAKPGDIVLLSAACASFDMFKNYKDRGEQFTKEVNKL